MTKNNLSLFRKIFVFLFIAFSLTIAGCRQPGDSIASQEVIEPQDRYGEVAERLEKIIRHEMAAKELPAFSTSSLTP